MLGALLLISGTGHDPAACIMFMPFPCMHAECLIKKLLLHAACCRTYKERQQDYNKARSRLLPNGVEPGAIPLPVKGRGMAAPPKGSPPPPAGRGSVSSLPAGGSAHAGQRQGDDQKAVFRNRDEEMRDPDFQRDAGRYSPRSLQEL